ncbi:hypothetical protein TSUD_354100 [Trifolium subterraneum]|uniref:G-patch domain-containing protein n=1 Tax=Trifolium subterraneum TaxID=3900 RepID=A0A2Z6M4T1_TRISU|nr:hypothetical protein TSUD_354100 [Trifolium subterraneum]
MDEDQEMEKFGMENDFEGGEWVGGEFYYRKRREKRHQTKEDVLYGVFADSEDDDDDEYSSRKRRKDFSKKQDLTKPVNFVSTGNFMPNQDNVNENLKEDDEKDNYVDEDRPGLGVGLGFGSASASGSGLGFNSGRAAMNGSHRNDESDENDNGDDKFLPTEFGKKIKEGAMRREKERLEKKKKGQKQKPGLGHGGSVDVGTFETHTKGIGMKLLEKMGYKKGAGLGKNEQGILNPIEAQLRAKNSGLGFNESKKTTTPLPNLQTEKSAPGGDLQPTVGRSRERSWLKQLKKKKKEDYVTAEELLASKQEEDSEVVQKIYDMRGPQVRVYTNLSDLNAEEKAKEEDVPMPELQHNLLASKQEEDSEVVQKIYDMRGPQVRVYTNLSDLNAEEKAKEEDVPMPELQHNVALIVRLAEADIQEIDRDLRKERDIALSLKKEKENLEAEASFQKNQLDNYEKIMSVLDRVGEENTLGTLTLDSLAQCFRDMHKRYPDDYKLCNLSCIACSYAQPLFIRVFQGWDPLRNPSHGFELVSQWKELLQGDDCFDIWDTSSPYTHLVLEVVLPAVRISGINTWNARDPEPMLRFFESWEKLLPSSVLDKMLDEVVLPKLSSAVSTWEPHLETIPIHTWVHPWLPLLGHKLEGIYEMIRFKLGTVLHAWHPSDGSAYAILSPWKTVFDSDSWQKLMHRFIVPKLKAVFVSDDFQVNPASQKLDQFYWVMNWASAIPVNLMVDTMEIFFTKWLTVLYRWLCSNPNFEEVTEWYLGWKELIPKELLANEKIRYKINCGLEMLNQAAEGMEVVQPGLKEKISYIRVSEQRKFERERNQQQPSVNADGANEMSVKEIIEAYARDHGLLFKLKPGRRHNGHQIYGFGNVSIIIDSLNQKIYAQNEEKWSLETLARLLELHNRSLSKRH